jgi:hypothetical protein
MPWPTNPRARRSSRRAAVFSRRVAAATSGPYRYFRNPMISVVVAMLLGGAFFFGSALLAGWAVLFILLNHVYFFIGASVPRLSNTRRVCLAGYPGGRHDPAEEERMCRLTRIYDRSQLR